MLLCFFIWLFCFGHKMWHVGFYSPDQRSNPRLLQQKRGVFTTGPLGKSQGKCKTIILAAQGFPCDSDSKISWRRGWKPTWVFLPREFYGHSIMADYCPWYHKEWDTTEQFYLTNTILAAQDRKVKQTVFIPRILTDHLVYGRISLDLNNVVLKKSK